MMLSDFRWRSNISSSQLRGSLAGLSVVDAVQRSGVDFPSWLRSHPTRAEKSNPRDWGGLSNLEQSRAFTRRVETAYVLDCLWRFMVRYMSVSALFYCPF